MLAPPCAFLLSSGPVDVTISTAYNVVYPCTQTACINFIFSLRLTSSTTILFCFPFPITGVIFFTQCRLLPIVIVPLRPVRLPLNLFDSGRDLHFRLEAIVPAASTPPLVIRNAPEDSIQGIFGRAEMSPPRCWRSPVDLGRNWREETF